MKNLGQRGKGAGNFRRQGNLRPRTKRRTAGLRRDDPRNLVPQVASRRGVKRSGGREGTRENRLPDATSLALAKRRRKRGEKYRGDGAALLSRCFRDGFFDRRANRADRRKTRWKLLNRAVYRVALGLRFSAFAVERLARDDGLRRIANACKTNACSGGG